MRLGDEDSTRTVSSWLHMVDTFPNTGVVSPFTEGKLNKTDLPQSFTWGEAALQCHG